MSDDIVERLRSWRHDSWPADPSREAADEIERLRARVEVLERACRLIAGDPDPCAAVECTGCYRHSRLAYHALETKP